MTPPRTARWPTGAWLRATGVAAAALGASCAVAADAGFREPFALAAWMALSAVLPLGAWLLALAFASILLASDTISPRALAAGRYAALLLLPVPAAVVAKAHGSGLDSLLSAESIPIHAGAAAMVAVLVAATPWVGRKATNGVSPWPRA